MAQARAKSGGQYGANGEWYEGGKFIATTAMPKKEGSAPKGSGKQEIAPYTWEVAPAGMRSLYRQFAGTFGTVGRDGIARLRDDDRLPQTLDYYGKTLDEVQRMIERYNAGQRWV